MALTSEEIATAKSTVPIPKEHGTRITKVFYENMLEAHPKLYSMFNKENQEHLQQLKALAAAV